ncbi:3-deoxy-manno-octulosonate cytidylyltransferase [Singulisphaera sp. PoT]|uniref:3-deoxy-manno-octulosonate cytidylyltransferase n=1 Tax=Singulisphaera sp. PoT TaxID=3411797 RepID=UPI003BF5BA49
MSVAIVIPARYGSERLKGKPMIEIAGVSLLERVWRIARACKGATRVVIATEDQRVVDFASSFGAEAVLTSDDCTNGTERVAEALDAASITEDAVINFQGDAVLTPPWILEGMIEEFASPAGFDIVTPAVKMTDEALAELKAHKVAAPSSGTTVTFDLNRNALYFSKQIIPFVRKAGFSSVYRHIGMYGYSCESLRRYVALPASPLEKTEGLEQLRALENGMKVRIVVVDYRGRSHGSVDTPEDVGVVEQMIAREGELIQI